MSRRTKRHQPNSGQRIAAPDHGAPNTDQLAPIFSLRHLVSTHSLSQCTPEEKAAFADTLQNLSKLPWVQLKRSQRHGLGCEKIERSALKVAIPPHVTEDITFLAFRFHGKAPMVGYRVGDVFHILWLDRDFTLYEH